MTMTTMMMMRVMMRVMAMAAVVHGDEMTVMTTATMTVTMMKTNYDDKGR